MVFDAHDHIVRFFDETRQQGIYDTMRTAVDAVFVGNECQFADA